MYNRPFIDMTTEETIISEANDIFEENVENIEDALEVFISNNEYDDIISTEGNEPENAARVCQWILFTDSQGNKTAYDYEDELTAMEMMKEYEAVIFQLGEEERQNGTA